MVAPKFPFGGGIGGGRYDAEVKAAAALTNADLTLLVVIGGAKGNGFSVTVDAEHADLLNRLPHILRTVAQLMEQHDG